MIQYAQEEAEHGDDCISLREVTRGVIGLEGTTSTDDDFLAPQKVNRKKMLMADTFCGDAASPLCVLILLRFHLNCG